MHLPPISITYLSKRNFAVECRLFEREMLTAQGGKRKRGKKILVALWKQKTSKMHFTSQRPEIPLILFGNLFHYAYSV